MPGEGQKNDERDVVSLFFLAKAATRFSSGGQKQLAHPLIMIIIIVCYFIFIYLFCIWHTAADLVVGAPID